MGSTSNCLKAPLLSADSRIDVAKQIINFDRVPLQLLWDILSEDYIHINQKYESLIKLGKQAVCHLCLTKKMFSLCFMLAENVDDLKTLMFHTVHKDCAWNNYTIPIEGMIDSWDESPLTSHEKEQFLSIILQGVFDTNFKYHTYLNNLFDRLPYDRMSTDMLEYVEGWRKIKGV